MKNFKFQVKNEKLAARSFSIFHLKFEI